MNLNLVERRNELLFELLLVHKEDTSDNDQVNVVSMLGYGQSRETVIFRVLGLQCTELNPWMRAHQVIEGLVVRAVFTDVMD